MNHSAFFVVGLMVTNLTVAPMSAAMDREKGVTQPQSERNLTKAPISRFKNVEGTLKEIQGNVYVLEENADGQSVRVEISQDTAFPNGQKEPGQDVQALVSSVNQHALIIR